MVSIHTVPGVGPGEGTVVDATVSGGDTAFGTAARPGIVGDWLINVRRGSDLQTIAEVDDFHSAELVFRFNDVGTWVLNLDMDTTAADLLLDPRSGIVVYRGDTLVFSGPTTKRRRVRNDAENSLVVSGWSDLAWLVWRLASPQPATSVPPYSSSQYDTRTGAASTIIRQYVDVNAGPGALSPRRVPLLTLAADPAVGESVTGEARWQTVLEIAQKLATKAANIGFDLKQVGTGLVFEVFQIIDRTEEIRFSEELGNLLAYEYEIGIPEANYVFTGGAGEGTARTILEVSDALSIAELGRLEIFRDARNHANATTQRQDANEQLLELAGEVNLEITARDLAQMAFLDHYELGDRVSAVIDDEPVTEAIREVNVTMRLDEAVLVEPKIATPKRTGLLAVLNELREHDRRLVGLERR